MIEINYMRSRYLYAGKVTGDTTMKKRGIAKRWRILAVCAITSLFIACESDFARAVRQVTYPPDFNYVSGEELRSSMQQLGYNLQQLDEALSEEYNGGTVERQQVVQALDNIENIAGSLRSGDGGSNHPFLEDYMATFLADVRRAQMGVAMNPPRYYMAGRVSGGCVNCHRVNR